MEDIQVFFNTGDKTYKYFAVTKIEDKGDMIYIHTNDEITGILIKANVNQIVRI